MSHAAPNSPTARSGWKPKALLALGATVLALCAAELALELERAREEARRNATPAPYYTWSTYSTDGRLISSKNGPLQLVLDPLLAYRNRPDQRGPWFTINSRGYRGPELRDPRPARRVVLIGGSAAFGTGVDADADTLAAHLEKALAPAEVVNAAVIGWVTAQELALLRSELLDLAPDTVVALDGVNDLRGYRVLRDGLVNTTTFAQVENLCWTGTQANTSFLFALGKTLARVFPELQDRIRAALTPGLASARMPDEAIAERAAIYVRNVHAMAVESAERGVRFVAVLQPELFRAEAYRRFREEALTRLRELDVDVLDANEFEGLLKGRNFLDPVHLRSEGNRLLAEELARYLAQPARRGES